jgi:hypothetical protein
LTRACRSDWQRDSARSFTPNQTLVPCLAALQMPAPLAAHATASASVGAPDKAGRNKSTPFRSANTSYTGSWLAKLTYLSTVSWYCSGSYSIECNTVLDRMGSAHCRVHVLVTLETDPRHLCSVPGPLSKLSDRTRGRCTPLTHWSPRLQLSSATTTELLSGESKRTLRTVKSSSTPYSTPCRRRHAHDTHAPHTLEQTA